MAKGKKGSIDVTPPATPATSATRRPLMAAAFGARGRMVMLPPTSREEAADEFGAGISEDTWREICDAFDRHGERLADLEVTRGNNNKNDKRGWKKRKGDAEKGIEKALSGLLKIDRDFLAEAADNVSSTGKAGIITGVEQRLDRAVKEIMVLSLIVRDAEPLLREIMTEVDSRKALARDVFTALEGAGAKLSNGWRMSQTEPSFADLSGFERLAELMQIHQGETPMATAKWLREALAQER
jgi:hypothetical protein